MPPNRAPPWAEPIWTTRVSSTGQSQMSEEVSFHIFCCCDLLQGACHCPACIYGELPSPVGPAIFCLSSFYKLWTFCDLHHTAWILKNFRIWGVPEGQSWVMMISWEISRDSLYTHTLSSLCCEYTRKTWKREWHRGPRPKTANHWVPRVLSAGISS